MNSSSFNVETAQLPSTMALTATQIPCCLCGTTIYPNAANQCSTCLSQSFNLQEQIQRGPGGSDKITIYQCRTCRKFQRTEKLWEHAEHESPQLLSICLRHIPALQNHTASSTHHDSNGPLHLIDANWIWTEPHCMRYKLRLTVRADVQNVRVQQRVVVLLHCVFQMCPECNREFTNRTWNSVVQLRQKLSQNDDQAPKKGLIVLEMALAKNKEIRKHVLKIDHVMNGFDFYFLTIPQAHAFVSYIQRMAPIRVRISKKLVSTDSKSNTANMKHTISCDMVPFCSHDLVIIHKSTPKCKLAGRLALVTKLASVIHFIDVSPKRSPNHFLKEYGMELSAETFYKHEKQYHVIQTSNRLVRFIVLDVELCSTQSENTQADDASVASLYQGPSSGAEKYALADVVVVRESDFGKNDTAYSTVTHLGHLIQPGDTVLGYDLASSSIDWELDENFHHSFILPDIVLVKKTSSKEDATPKGTKSIDDTHPVDDALVQNNVRRLTRKKEKRLRKDGKRTKELEDHASRMGFIDAKADYLNDPELEEEVLALEHDLQAAYLDTNVIPEVDELEDGLDDDYDHVDDTDLDSAVDEIDHIDGTDYRSI
jgi:nonsense-mediated mRNA decay protein 3